VIPLDPRTVQRWFNINQGELRWSSEGYALFANTESDAPVLFECISKKNFVRLPGGFLVSEYKIRFCAAFGAWNKEGMK
jgi:hypothetical protein